MPGLQGGSLISTDRPPEDALGEVEQKADPGRILHPQRGPAGEPGVSPSSVPAAPWVSGDELSYWGVAGHLLRVSEIDVPSHNS